MYTNQIIKKFPIAWPLWLGLLLMPLAQLLKSPGTQQDVLLLLIVIPDERTRLLIALFSLLIIVFIYFEDSIKSNDIRKALHKYMPSILLGMTIASMLFISVTYAAIFGYVGYKLKKP